jgi:hypothetical protein
VIASDSLGLSGAKLAQSEALPTDRAAVEGSRYLMVSEQLGGLRVVFLLTK